jgi:glycosyltransferase involved in cell wall biosynthesis
MQHRYLEDHGIATGATSVLTRLVLHYARLWDVRTANGVDVFIANSRYISQRIWRVYRRESVVVYPPVAVEQFGFQDKKDDYYVAASRLVPYKKMLNIVKAFALHPRRRLVLIGDGPEMATIRAVATQNVEILGHVSFETLRDHLQRARAFVFAAEEDFGIAPVEAQACGTPVIAFGRGGVAESVRGLDAEIPTGVFYDAQDPTTIARAIESFERNADRISSQACRANARRFSIEEFRSKYLQVVEESWEKFRWRT